MLSFSLRLNNDLPATAYPPLAQAAEQAGFAQLWVSNDLFLSGVWPILTACALVTNTIKLGTCIVNPVTTHPAEIAMQATALDALSNGRALLGVGAGAEEFLDWVGLERTRPLAHMRDTIAVLRALLAGEPAAGTWPVLGTWRAAAHMRVTTRPIPIYLGATSPKMRELIGECADGGLPLLFPPEQWTTVHAQVATGAARTGRDLAPIDLAACVWVSIAADQARAVDALRAKVAYYANALSNTILHAVDVSRAEALAVSTALQVDGLDAAKALVPANLLRVGIAGDAAAVVARLAPLVAQGARHISFGPPLGPDPLAAIGLLGHVMRELQQ